jgi:protein gp37
VGIKTGIGWCDSSVNPVVGCDGCELHQKGKKESHCYAAGLVRRYAGLPGWPISFDGPELMHGRLAKAIKWPDLTGTERPEKPWLNGYPRIIFLCDLADPFTESIDPESWLTPTLPAMADSPHVYILLTKRGRRMLAYWRSHRIPRNVWQGVTVTGPETLIRAEQLMAVPGASVRFISAEPLLGPVNLELLGQGPYSLDWVIAGGESGPGARAMDPLWARWLRDQCQAAAVPFFFKQWGGAARGRWLDDAIWSEMPMGVRT